MINGREGVEVRQEGVRQIEESRTRVAFMWAILFRTAYFYGDIK
jgi:hypothetical protein